LEDMAEEIGGTREKQVPPPRSALHRNDSMRNDQMR
jgi:hypothetical protein